MREEGCGSEVGWCGRRGVKRAFFFRRAGHARPFLLFCPLSLCYFAIFFPALTFLFPWGGNGCVLSLGHIQGSPSSSSGAHTRQPLFFTLGQSVPPFSSSSPPAPPAPAPAPPTAERVCVCEGQHMAARRPPPPRRRHRHPGGARVARPPRDPLQTLSGRRPAGRRQQQRHHGQRQRSARCHHRALPQHGAHGRPPGWHHPARRRGRRCLRLARPPLHHAQVRPHPGSHSAECGRAVGRHPLRRRQPSRRSARRVWCSRLRPRPLAPRPRPPPAAKSRERMGVAPPPAPTLCFGVWMGRVASVTRWWR